MVDNACMNQLANTMCVSLSLSLSLSRSLSAHGEKGHGPTIGFSLKTPTYKIFSLKKYLITNGISMSITL
jgi:hypothetical protein